MLNHQKNNNPIPLRGHNYTTNPEIKEEVRDLNKKIIPDGTDLANTEDTTETTKRMSEQKVTVSPHAPTD